jgi:hypothetical protein
MKTVVMEKDFDYRPHPRRTVRFHGGVTYARVLEAAALQIERAGAGRIAMPSDPAGTYETRDASAAFRPRGKR